MGSDGLDEGGISGGGTATGNEEQADDGVNTSDEQQRATLTTERTAMRAQGSGDAQASSSSSPENNTSSSSESSRSDREPSSRKRGKKLDRSKLRKGKWTVEEEEYTSRIIHYFSTGLLTLPEGATLRSYLAEKLNCDPMRITKKYAGASCLGRRVYQFRELVHPTMADIQVARTELDHLEQRFRMRVEGDAGGQSVQRSSHTSQSLVQPSAQALLPTPIPSQNPIQNLLLGLLGAQAAAPGALQIPTFVGSGTPEQPTTIQAPAPSLMGSSSATGQPTGVSAPPSQNTVTNIVPNQQPPAPFMFPQGALDLSGATIPAQGSAPGIIDPNLANWVLLQAAASLGPALTQLAAVQQQQQQPQQVQVQQQQPQQFQVQQQQPQIQQQLTHQHLAQHQLAHQQLAQHQQQQQQLNQQHLVQKQQPQAIQQQQASAPAPTPAPAGDQVNTIQSQQQQLQAQIREQQAKLQQQLMQLNAAAAAAAASSHTPQATQTFPVAQPAGQNPARAPHSHAVSLNPTPPTMGSIRMDSAPQVVIAPAPPTATTQQPVGQNAAEHFTKDLKQAYNLHLKSQRDHDATKSSTVEASPAVGFSTLNGLGIPNGIVGNVPTLPQQQQQHHHLPPATRTEEDRAAGTALLGFLSSLRQSYETALRDQHGGAAGVTANRADSPSFPNKSDSSDENRAATVTDSNAGSNQPDSSVEDSDWNSDKKAEPSSSEESDDKETPGKASKERAPKRQKLATHEV